MVSWAYLRCMACMHLDSLCMNPPVALCLFSNHDLPYCSCCLVMAGQGGSAQSKSHSAVKEVGRGMWSCVMCGSSGPGTMMHCNKGPLLAATGCRVCNTCRWSRPEGEETVTPYHRCLHASEDMSKCRMEDHNLLVLPDLGMGRDEWEMRGLTPGWGQGSWWSIREQKHADRLFEMIRHKDASHVANPRKLIQQVYDAMDGEDSQRHRARHGGNDTAQTPQSNLATTAALDSRRGGGGEAGVDKGNQGEE